MRLVCCVRSSGGGFAMKSFVPMAGVTCALLIATPALAHHGWGGYLDTESDVTGTVESVSFGRAHTSIKVRGDDGTIWQLVLSPPYATVSVGIRENTIPVGATVSARGHRHRDVNRFEIKTEQITMGEQTFNIYPGRREKSPVVVAGPLR